MGIVKVNRSGRNYNVYASNEYGAEKIGTIYNNEILPGTYAFVDMDYGSGTMMNSNFNLIGSI